MIAKFLCHRCAGSKGWWAVWSELGVALKHWLQCGACNGEGWISRP